MKIYPLLTSTLLASVLAVQGADSVEEIVNEHEQAKVEDLKTYLEENPEAEDREVATEHLINAYNILGDREALTPLYQDKFDALIAQDQPDMQELLVGTVRPLVDLYASQGNKEKAIEVIETTRNSLGAFGSNQQIQGFLDQMKSQLDRPMVGSKFDLEFTSVDGHEVDLSEMTENDKVVLVDFWATWCGPCIAELPNLLDAYEKWHDKGFEIIGISLDQSLDELQQFTSQRGMDWPQYFDGKGWENDLADKYGIKSIPATFLVGKDGKIVAADLRGGQLDAKLQELLGGNEES